MGPVKCPTCDVIIPPAEVAEGWCENCGKKIPRFALKDNDSPGVSSTATSTTSSTAGAKVSGKSYLILTLFIVLGAIVTTIIQGGKTNLVWIGCGVGAGLGVLVAQATGYWAKPARA